MKANPFPNRRTLKRTIKRYKRKINLFFEHLWMWHKGLENCNTCDGDGSLHISSCCGSLPRGNGDSDSSDYGVCSDCGEHCEYGEECEDCDGIGKVKKISPNQTSSL